MILCVTAANQDLSTSDALKLALEVDQSGSRTLGVLTKVDLMDRGTNARKMILNQEVRLHLGYVGVRLRSQADSADGLSLKAALDQEKDYFSSHPVYSAMPQDSLGVASLSNKLTALMYSHIRKCMPAIAKELREKIQEKNSKL